MSATLSSGSTGHTVPSTPEQSRSTGSSSSSRIIDIRETVTSFLDVEERDTDGNLECEGNSEDELEEEEEEEENQRQGHDDTDGEEDQDENQDDEDEEDEEENQSAAEEGSLSTLSAVERQAILREVIRTNVNLRTGIELVEKALEISQKGNEQRAVVLVEKAATEFLLAIRCESGSALNKALVLETVDEYFEKSKLIGANIDSDYSSFGTLTPRPNSLQLETFRKSISVHSDTMSFELPDEFQSFDNDSDSTFDVSEWSEAPHECDFGDDFALSIYSESDTNPDRDDPTKLLARRKSNALPRGLPSSSSRITHPDDERELARNQPLVKGRSPMALRTATSTSPRTSLNSAGLRTLRRNLLEENAQRFQTPAASEAVTDSPATTSPSAEREDPMTQLERRLSVEVLTKRRSILEIESPHSETRLSHKHSPRLSSCTGNVPTVPKLAVGEISRLAETDETDETQSPRLVALLNSRAALESTSVESPREVRQEEDPDGLFEEALPSPRDRTASFDSPEARRPRLPSAVEHQQPAGSPPRRSAALRGSIETRQRSRVSIEQPIATSPSKRPIPGGQSPLSRSLSVSGGEQPETSESVAILAAASTQSVLTIAESTPLPTSKGSISSASTRHTPPPRSSALDACSSSQHPAALSKQQPHATLSSPIRQTGGSAPCLSPRTAGSVAFASVRNKPLPRPPLLHAQSIGEILQRRPVPHHSPRPGHRSLEEASPRNSVNAERELLASPRSCTFGSHDEESSEDSDDEHDACSSPPVVTPRRVMWSVEPRAAAGAPSATAPPSSAQQELPGALAHTSSSSPEDEGEGEGKEHSALGAADRAPHGSRLRSRSHSQLVSNRVLAQQRQVPQLPQSLSDSDVQHSSIKPRAEALCSTATATSSSGHSNGSTSSGGIRSPSGASTPRFAELSPRQGTLTGSSSASESDTAGSSSSSGQVYFGDELVPVARGLPPRMGLVPIGRPPAFIGPVPKGLPPRRADDGRLKKSRSLDASIRSKVPAFRFSVRQTQRQAVSPAVSIPRSRTPPLSSQPRQQDETRAALPRRSTVADESGASAASVSTGVHQEAVRDRSNKSRSFDISSHSAVLHAGSTPLPRGLPPSSRSATSVSMELPTGRKPRAAGRVDRWRKHTRKKSIKNMRSFLGKIGKS
eukprot:CAMPEP_0177679138 /NCGR_PEP_ID=MMETSP0447-20121125/29431_1 /TAXON_ID=0 /ORGANISM="Stygamoeba regulata, Strain BSH-02190019" /LENGTH=1156 /DNA_ID=CAMNT_0019188285 /DNA_START=209 /DNA_END=3679 /DNA_ORIENTATION=+